MSWEMRYIRGGMEEIQLGVFFFFFFFFCGGGGGGGGSVLLSYFCIGLYNHICMHICP